MSASVFNAQSDTTAAHARRSGVDVLIERAARSLLAWSDRRAAKNRISHERMALILENQRNSTRGGSSGGR
jgi:hypothetical protein